jgi:hypothetical protein
MLQTLENDQYTKLIINDFKKAVEDLARGYK